MGEALELHSGRVFWETGLQPADPRFPQLARTDLPYTRSGRAFDLHGYVSAEAALAAWVRRALRDFPDRSEGLKVISGAQRRVFCGAFSDTPLVCAFDPVLLRRARVGKDELLAGEWHARWRVAGAARRVPGAHGLLIPATIGEGISVVLFATFITEHLEVLRSKPQRITLSEFPRPEVRRSGEGVVVPLRPAASADFGPATPQRASNSNRNRFGHSA